MRKIFVRSVPPLQTASLQAEEASHYNANVSLATFKRFNVSIFFVKLSTIIYLTNQAMIPESGITRRRQSKNVHRLPFFFLAPIPCYFSFRPIPHLGACSQARSMKLYASVERPQGRAIRNQDGSLSIKAYNILASLNGKW